jgi:hypothetical protein
LPADDAGISRMMLRMKSNPWHKLQVRFESFAVIVLSAATESGHQAAALPIP